MPGAVNPSNRQIVLDSFAVPRFAANNQPSFDAGLELGWHGTGGDVISGGERGKLET